VGNLPRIDLVTLRRSDSQTLKSIEIKLTALPDSTTYHLDDARYGCEIVVRQDTIVYLALSIAHIFRETPEELHRFLSERLPSINNWEADEILPIVPQMVATLNSLMGAYIEHQEPLVLQPVWKTIGRTPQLHDQAFDVFVWSNFAFTRLFFRTVRSELRELSRPVRSVIWLTKLLMDFAADGRIDHDRIINTLTYSRQSDKGFSITGAVSHQYMDCDQLTTPRIHKSHLRNIILGGGQHFLSPERRLDAIIVNSPDLFE
jgi:hypothetical protein